MNGTPGPERHLSLPAWWHWASRVAAAAWMAFIFWLSSHSTLHIPYLFHWQDKLEHGVTFGILAGCYLFAQVPAGGRYRRWQVLVAALLAGAYGITDEWHQAYVPGRQADVADVMADLAGGLLLAALAALVANRVLARFRPGPAASRGGRRRTPGSAG